MEEKKLNGCALASLIMSIIGLFLFGYILGSLSVVLGIIGLATGKEQNGKGLAIAGIVIGALDAILLIVFQIAGVTPVI